MNALKFIAIVAMYASTIECRGITGHVQYFKEIHNEGKH